MWYRKIFLLFVKLKDSIKGKATYHKKTSKPIESVIKIKLQTHKHGEQDLIFNIKKEIYEIKYPLWIFNQQRHMYEINCVLPDGNINDFTNGFDLRSHYVTPIYVSSLLSWAYDEESQLQAVIGFFLDIKLADIPE